MDFLTTKQDSERWKILQRRVSLLYEQGAYFRLPKSLAHLAVASRCEDNQKKER